jgi:hypothetical protein
MAYTTINKSTDYFNTVLYNGTGSSQSITGVGFQPDWLWQKSRSNTQDGRIFDAVRGGSKLIYPSLTNAESTDAQLITSFDSDGFTMGSSGSNVNDSGTTNVAWNWKANGAGSSNTDGGITSTVSANTTSGFSIVTYTSGGGSGTVGHGLNSVPKVMFYKPLSTSGGWDVYHHSLGISNRLNLHNDAAQSAGYFQTLPTNLVFTEPNLYSGQSVIMYCFAEKKGFSKFGSYEGNTNTDGVFIYTGFKPAFIMIKSYNTAVRNWTIQDNKRSSSGGSNPNDKWLYANSSEAEANQASNPMDFLSNGFKLRNTGSYQNQNAYIYMAFAEAPLVGSNNVPATAR